MSTFIDSIFDKIGNVILPKTVTKAVWGQASGNRLDQELDGIEAALAQPNTGVNADSAYSAGKYIYHVKNKELYKAKSNIASGAAFNKASGGNVDVVKIGDQLQSISGDLASLITYQDFTFNVEGFSGATIGMLIAAKNTSIDVTKTGYTPIGVTLTNFDTESFNVEVLLINNTVAVRFYAAKTAYNFVTQCAFRVVYIKS